MTIDRWFGQLNTVAIVISLFGQMAASAARPVAHPVAPPAKTRLGLTDKEIMDILRARAANYAWPQMAKLIGRPIRTI